MLVHVLHPVLQARHVAPDKKYVYIQLWQVVRAVQSIHGDWHLVHTPELK